MRNLRYLPYAVMLLTMLFVSCFTRVDVLEELKAQPEIVISGKLEEWVDFHTLDNRSGGLDFSFVEVYSSRIALFSIENRGAVALRVKGIAISGDTSQFSVDSAGIETEIPRKGSTQFSVLFKPTRQGLVSAEVIIESNDPDDTLYRFTVKGTGTSTALPYSGPNISIVRGSKILTNGEIYSFGQTELQRSNAVTLTIKNTGDVPLSIENILYTGDVTQFITIDPTLPLVLQPNSGRDITITFNPLSVGKHTMTVTYISDDPDTDSFSIVFEGVGTETSLPDIRVKQGMDDILPGSMGYNFGTREIGTSSSPVPFTVENFGWADLYIDDISSNDDTQFSVVHSAPIVLSPEGIATFTVTFSPDVPDGQKSAQITIQSNDPDADENPFIFSVQGNGVAPGSSIPQVTLWRSSDLVANGSVGYDFGTIEKNSTSAPVTFTILNDGTADLVLLSYPEFNPGDSDQFSIDVSTITAEPPVSIPPGGSEAFSVTYAPVEKGVFEAAIGIETNDPATPFFSFRVRGRGTDRAAPSMQVYQNSTLIANGSSYYFGEVPENSQGPTVTFEITNSGTSDLEIKRYKKLNGSTGDFIVEMENTPFIVAPGGSKPFTVAFSPSDTGPIYTRLQIVSNDVIYYIRLEGNGIE